MTRCFIVFFSIFLYFSALLSFQPAYANSRSNPLISLASPLGSQNANYYNNPTRKNVPLITKRQQQRLSQRALQKFFSPWISASNYSSAKKAEMDLAKRYLKNPQYGFNYHKNSRKWMQGIVDNMNLAGNGTRGRNAIMINNANMRVLPTDLPIFKSHTIPGQGYPFDQLSISALWVGEPIRVLNTSTDGAWVLIEDHNAMGWIRQHDIAYVNRTFIKKYRTKHFIAMTQDNAPVTDRSGNFLFYSRVGMIFPIINNSIQVPVRILPNRAKLLTAEISKTNYASYPLKPTPANFSLLMNRMMGAPYGWGGLYLLRDCSLTTQNLLLPFGILLPRNSLWQAKSDQRIMLTGMSDQQKSRYIMQHGKPFVTLLHSPGHIMLYIGNKNSLPIIFQNKWGMHTEGRNGYYGRAVIGKAHITSLQLGNNIRNATGNLLEQVDSITVLIN